MSLTLVVAAGGELLTHTIGGAELDAVHVIVQERPELVSLFDSPDFGEAVPIERSRFIHLAKLALDTLLARGARIDRFLLDDEPIPGVKTTGSINAVGLEINGELAEVEVVHDKCILRLGLYKDQNTGLLVGREERDVSHLKQIETDTSRVVTIRKRRIKVDKLAIFLKTCLENALANNVVHVFVTIA